MKENSRMNSRRNFIKMTSAGIALFSSPFIFAGNGGIGMKRSIGSKEQAFLQACIHGKVDEVRTFLDSDSAFLMSKDEHGRSGFALALLSGHKAVGELLKERGYRTDLHETVLDLNWDGFEEMLGEESEKTAARVNADHPIGGTVMWAAAAGGSGNSLWRVYSKGGDPNLNPRKENGSTALQKALSFPTMEVAKVTAATLLSNNADPNPPINAEMPPLHLATVRGNTELVEMLIRLGADVNALNKEGKTAAQLADYFGHEALFTLLIHHEQIPRTCRTSRTASDLNGDVYQAPEMDDIPQYKRSGFVGSSHRNLDALKEGVAQDARLVHSVATTGEIAVEAGAHVGRKDIVGYLIELGAPYSLPTAVMMNDFTAVTRMLDADPNRIQERGAHDYPLLWYPVLGEADIEMMQLLLDRGANIEQQHFLGSTALHWACYWGRIDLVELLIENGADVNRVRRTFSGKIETPLQTTDDEKIAQYLRSKGAK